MARSPLVPPVVGGFVLALLVAGFLLVVAGIADASPLIRVVRPGECLSEIAQEYNVSVAQLRRWNDLDGDTITVGQRLIVGYRGSRGRAGRGPSSPRQNVIHVVVEGDTLSEIADRYDVEVEDIVEANAGLEADHIEVGQRIAIPRGSRPTRSHVVRRGETLSQIALRYGVDVEDILRWNRGLRPRSLSIGRRLTIHPRRLPPSESIGRPWAGKVANARRLQPHPLFVIRDPSRSWGTEETVRWIHEAFDEVRRRHPRANKVRVHDLSFRDGGPIDGHRSHQSGRDVDIIYFQRRCPRSGCQMQSILPREMDAGPQWTLFRNWIRRGRAQVIFVDYGLQGVLYREARRRGANRAQLAAWFQYPRGRRAPGGVIRHFPNHRNHVHVRFVCARGDRECE